jgi:carboxypeptidase C (cathepsin A)
MKNLFFSFLAGACALALLLPAGVRGQSKDQPAEGKFPAPPAVEKISKTEHSITAHGRKLSYTALAGTLLLDKDDGKPRASVFFTSYTLSGVEDTAKRPITFVFNGGPGSSSVWLHMGALGPKRVEMGPEGEQPPPPYHLVDNDDTALTFTDLVFIDPVSTGFSRPAPGEDPKQFHGLEGDLESVGDFIRIYLTRYERWPSPKFLAGESYGTTRASALSLHLLSDRGIYLNGITLISSVLNFETLDEASGNELPYALFLPSFTAAAWYHKKLSPELEKEKLPDVVEQARRFAGGDYTLALMKGAKLTSGERAALAKQMARLTGLSEDYILLSNLRVSQFKFFRELLRDQKRSIGRYDSPLVGIPADATGVSFEYDPSYASVQGAYTAMFNAYVRSELNYASDMPYEILTGKVQPWGWNEYQNQFVDVSGRLRKAITENPNLRVLFANGYYDMATPFFATEYTVNHLGLDPSLQNNISLTYCEAGHMLYTKKTCLESLHASMENLYRQALAGSH